MRFLLGLVTGVLIGGGAVYLALERPWQTADPSLEAPDAGVEVASKDKKGKRKRGRKRRAARAGAGDAVPTLSAADRKMQWKGEAVKLPPRTLDLGSSGDGGRPLSPGEINQVIQGQSSSILGCIAKARGNALLESTVIVKMLVGPGGRATKIRVRAPAYLFAHGFNPCVRKAARGLRFAATGDHTVVEVPYEMSY